jgi:drug/metabolite transporter (DMT)-like permease
MSNKTKTILSDLGLLYAAAIWGSTFFVVKDSLAGIDPVLLVAARFSLAAALMGGYLLLKRQPLFYRYKAGFVLGAWLWLIYGPQTIGLKITTAANSAFITGLFVAFVPVLSLILKRRSSLWQWVAVGVSLVGLWLLTGGLSQANLGDTITLISAFAYAAHILAADRYVKENLDPFILAFQQFLTVGLISFLVALFFNLPFQIASWNTAGIVLFLALFPTVSAFIIQFFAQKHTAPLKVSLIFALEPVFGAVFAWTLGGEEFILRNALGGLLIFAAILLSNLSSPMDASPA